MAVAAQSSPRLVLVSSLLGGGGAERVMLTMAGWWKGTGCSVTVVVLRADRAVPDYPVPDGVAVRRLDLIAERNPVWNPGLSLKLVALRRALLGERPDVVVSFSDKLNAAVLLALAGSGIPVIATEHLPPWRNDLGIFWGALRRLTYAHAAAVVSPTEAITSWFQRNRRGKFLTLPSPASLDFAAIDEPRELTILAAGRLNRQKGFDLLIDAFATLAAGNPGWRLEIAGEGPERSVLLDLIDRARLQGRVLLCGHVSDVAHRLRRSEIFVLSSRHEAYPMVLCEAMAAGCCVVATACPTGPREILGDDGSAGILVDAENVEALAAGLDRAMADASLRRRLGRAAKEKARDLGAPAVMPKWDSLLNRITPRTQNSKLKTQNPEPKTQNPKPSLHPAFIIDSLALGGAQKHICQMAAGLAARGHRVDVICLNEVCHPSMLAALSAAGISVTVIGRRAMLLGPGFFRLYRHLSTVQPDVVVTVLFASTVAGRLAARLVGVGRVATCIQARNIHYRWWQFALLRLTSGSTAKFFFNCRTAVPFACKHEGARLDACHYIPNGIAAPPTAHGPPSTGHGPRPALRSSTSEAVSTVYRAASPPPSWSDWGLPFQSEDEVVATIGRLDSQKGYASLLRAFALVLARRPKARLLIVGAGPQERELRALAQELGVTGQVIFAGERAEGAAIAALARLYVQPSLFEGTPNALMEAIAAGVPSIASAVDGIPEIIADGETGWLVPPNEPAALAHAIVAALQDPVRASSIGLRGQKAILEEFTLPRMIDAYEKHFLELTCE